ncbi:MAG: hypothetical protein ABR615_01500 [Pseudonocardiaceae bacterium]
MTESVFAQSAGFRVTVAATLPPDQINQLGGFRAVLDSLHIDRDDQRIRALAHRGAAQTGLELTAKSLIPEVTRHRRRGVLAPRQCRGPPISCPRPVPPREAIIEVRRRVIEHRAHADAAAHVFPCA